MVVDLLVQFYARKISERNRTEYSGKSNVNVINVCCHGHVNIFCLENGNCATVTISS